MSVVLAPSYVHCANDGEICHITGKKSVAYVRRDRTDYNFFKDVDGLGGTNVTCNDKLVNASVADNIERECLLSDIPAGVLNIGTIDDKPIGFTQCAAEGTAAECNPLGSEPVDFIYGGKVDTPTWTYAGANKIGCEGRFFGNNKFYPGFACYWRKHVDSSISAPAPPPDTRPKISSNYKFCAAEGETCTISGNKALAFTNATSAADDTVFRFYSEADNPTVPCSWDGIGAYPSIKIPGRKCLVVDIPDNIHFDAKGEPVGFTKCPSNTNCKSGYANADFLYGADSKYIYAQTPQVTCDVDLFGDPAQGVNKNCYFREYIAAAPVAPSSAPVVTSPSGPTETKSKSYTIWYIAGIILLVIIIIVALIFLYRNSRKNRS